MSELPKCACGKVFLTESQLDKHELRCSEVNRGQPDSFVESNYKVTEEQCAEMRRKVAGGTLLKELDSMLDVCSTTIQQHINGYCSHENDQSSLTWNRDNREWIVDDN